MEDFEDRPYQQAIIDVCIERNSIVYLPTGAGKSYIAIQVIKHFSNQLERKYSDGGKRSIFLVNTVCLAKQQAECISDMLPYSVSVLCGEQNVDYWEPEDWYEVLEKNEILVATAQVILDAIKRRYLHVGQINVIVFDECHHGCKDHAYHEIMKQFDDDAIKQCRIIGLSGMLIGNNNKIKPNTVNDELVKLEATYQSTVITVNKLDDYKNVLLCSTNAKEGFLRYSKEPLLHSSIISVINILETTQSRLEQVKFENYQTINPKSLRETTPRKVKDLILMFKDFKYQAVEMGPFGGYLSLLSTLIQFELIKRWCDTDRYKEIVKYCITVAERSINKLELDLTLSRDDPAVILQHSSHKVRQLVELLRVKFTQPDREKDLQCLIFVKQRSTAKALYHLLKAIKTHDPSFPIEPDFMVGINNEMPESIEAILNTNYNSITLEKFKNKETNCIVSTSVLEEGIDLQMCNLVVMYDRPETYRSYVQARGRARVNNSMYAVLVSEIDVQKFTTKVEVWRNVDLTLKVQLLGRTIDRQPPTEDDIEKERQELWPPFITPISKSKLNNVNSISLLNHYSMKMPSDRFTNVSIMWRRIDLEDKKVIAGIELPSESVIKEEILSDPMSNVKTAKQHAAFKACIMLYENGELNDNLVPIDVNQKVEQYHHEYFAHWEEYAGDTKSAGTRNHRRYHKMKTPNVLQDCAPKVGAISFLYRIIVRPKFDIPNHAIETFRDLMANQKGFGILTSKRIPKLCLMTLFQSYGEIEVEISDRPIAVTLNTESELKLLQNFHVAIFRDVLKTWENFFIIDKTSYLIVSLNEDAEIDMRLTEEFQFVEQPRRLGYDEIKQMNFESDAYHHRVVNPVYRDTDQKYVVIHVHEHMTPLSPFPNEEYDSYKEYVKAKYDLTVCKDEQPMIEVKGISLDLNLFFPGAGVGGKQRRHEKEHLTEHYIPELCHNYKFPGDYWLKATLLPSVCHRIHYLLLAEELRQWLIDEGIDDGYGPQYYKLDVDYGNYDERESTLHDIEREHKTSGNLADLIERLRQIEKDVVAGTSTSEEARHTKALLLWNKSEMPIDLDRNWFTVTEVDIDYYCNFLNINQNKKSPASISRLQQLNRSPQRTDKFLMDVDDRKEIKLIRLDGHYMSVQQKHLIKVLTTSNAGDVFDMERYEVLGDGFLKFICSLYLYKEYEQWHEGYLTSLKGRLVSNRNLFYIGNSFGLSEMLKATKFKAKELLPQSITLPSNVQDVILSNMSLLRNLLNLQPLEPQEILDGALSPYNIDRFQKSSDNRPVHFVIESDQPQEEEDDDDSIEKSLLPYMKQQCIGDKIIADAVEAFIGVVIQSLGVSAGLKLCQKLKVLPNENKLENILSEKIPPRKAIKNTSTREAKVHNRQELEKIIGYTFNDPLYLLQALTHASYPIKIMGTYQQLEFLGDAVLDFLVTSYITEQCPKMDPGQLTDLRSSLVNNVTLACIIVRNGLHKFLLSENCLLSEAIKKFVDFQASKDNRIVLDQIILLDTEDDTKAAESVDVPKVIGDIFESLIGAIFLDSGLDLAKTWDVIYGLMKSEIHEFMINVPKQIVRQLFEFEKGNAEPRFFKHRVIDEDSVAVPVEITLRGERKIFIGIGKNKSVARKCAAKLALKALKEPAK